MLALYIAIKPLTLLTQLHFTVPLKLVGKCFKLPRHGYQLLETPTAVKNCRNKIIAYSRIGVHNRKLGESAVLVCGSVM